MGAEAERLTLDELTLLVTTASDVTFTGSLHGSLTWISSGVADLVGWTPGEMIGQPFTNFVHPDDHRAVTNGRLAGDSGGTGRIRVRLLLKDGGHRWVDVLVRTRFDAAGKAIQRFGSWRNAEDEVRLQDSLQWALSESVRSVERLRATLDSMLDPHACLEAVRDDAGMVVDFMFVDANSAAEAFNGVGAGGLAGVLLLGKHPSAGVTTFFEDCVRVVETGEPLVRDDWTYPQDMRGGELRRYDVRGVRISDGLSLTWRDVTDRFEAAERLAESEEHYRLLSANATDMVALWRDGRCAWASPSMLAFHGLDLEQIIGAEGRSLVAPGELALFDETSAGAEAGQVRRIRMSGKGPDGDHWIEVHVSPYLDHLGVHQGVLTSSRVIDDMVAAERQLERLARFDPLTGLMSRSETLRAIDLLLAQQTHAPEHIALLFCDVDRFKDVNDAHGHAAGDEVLRATGERLRSAIRSDGFAGRIGGDEFLIAVTGIHGLDEAVAAAEGIRTAAGEPIAFEGGVLMTPSISIGVTFARPGETTDALLRRADSAMYRAKHAGRDQVVAIV